MARFKSELDSIIAQIRSGNTDPELIASALEALTDAGFTRDYDIMVIQFRGWGGVDNKTALVKILENTFGAEPVISVPAGDLSVKISIPSVSGMNDDNTRAYFENSNFFVEEVATSYAYTMSIGTGVGGSGIDIFPVVYDFGGAGTNQTYSALGSFVSNTLVIKKLK